MICPSCGRETREGSKFCPVCGTSFDYAPAPEMAEAKKPGRRYWLIALIALVAVLVIGGGIAAFLLLRSPAKKAKVPDIVGLSLQEARELVEGEGLKLQEVDVSLSAFEDQEIIAQEPEAGEEIARGSTVEARVNNLGGDGEADGEDGADGTGEKDEKELSGLATITASSVMPPDVATVDYVPQNLVDYDMETCWSEGAAGYGVGEWVKFTFPGEVEITRIEFMPGYLKTSKGVDRWLQNGRLQVVDIAFDGGMDIEQAFRDERVYQQAVPGSPVKTTSVTITIVSVFPGVAGPGWEAAEDTCVSEIHIFGYE